MKVEVMIMYVRIDYNLKYIKKKVRRKILFGYIFLVINKCKKSKCCEFSKKKREKCFDWWEVGSVEIN